MTRPQIHVHNPLFIQQLCLLFINVVALFFVFIFLSPDFVANIFWKSSYFPVLFFSFFIVFWLFTAISGRWKQSLLLALSIAVWLWLHINHIDSLVTVLLLIFFNIVWTYYWRISQSTHSLKEAV